MAKKKKASKKASKKVAKKAPKKSASKKAAKKKATKKTSVKKSSKKGAKKATTKKAVKKKATKKASKKVAKKVSKKASKKISKKTSKKAPAKKPVPTKKIGKAKKPQAIHSATAATVEKTPEVFGNPYAPSKEPVAIETEIDDEFEFEAIGEDQTSEDLEDLSDPFDDPAADAFEDDDDLGDDEGYF